MRDRSAVRLAVSVGAIASVLFLSCSSTMPPWNTNAVPAAERPADVPLEKWVGRGMMLQINIRLEDGSEFPCALDTGSPTSLLPASAERTLGPLLGSGRLSTLENPEATHVYGAPKIYLGNTRLATGSTIGTWNSPEAILGMDCLSHYCIQLDFAARRMRFLDPEHVDVAGLGKAFPLVNSPYVMIKHAGLFQLSNDNLLVDTGCFADGYLDPLIFRVALRGQFAGPLPMKGRFDVKTPDFAEVPKCVWDGATYTDLRIGKGPQNLIGMRFLARHLVTFNFPKGVMYLKRITSAPLR